MTIFSCHYSPIIIIIVIVGSHLIKLENKRGAEKTKIGEQKNSTIKKFITGFVGNRPSSGTSTIAIEKAVSDKAVVRSRILCAVQHLKEC